MRIAIFGSGGVGGYYGARLAQAGHDVAFIARGSHLAAMLERGLSVESIEGDVHLDSVEASDDPADVGPVELVLVAIKTYQLADAAQQMLPLLAADTQVLPLLNGVEAPAQLAAALPRGRVLAGLTRILSFIDGPGRIRHIGAVPTILLGPREPGAGSDPRIEAVLGALRSAGVAADIPADIEAALWRKFQMVVSMGGVGAVTRSPIGAFRSQPESRMLLEAAIDEIQAVGLARGVALPPVTDEALAFIDAVAAEGTTSMQRDLADGRPSELDAWNGAVVRLGAEVGVDTPVHRFIYASLLPWERRARGEIAF